MNNRILTAISGFLTVAMFTIITGCGGGGGGFDAGIDRLGVSAGTVTEIGSISVNGVKFDTGSATFDIDDSPGSLDDLSVGDYVIVSYDPAVSSTVARTVYADEAVEGRVDSVNTVTGKLVVAGQTVWIDANTSFGDGISPAALDSLVGQFVEISGLFDAALEIRATRIELSTDEEAEVHGLVSSLDTGAMTFQINALKVDYSSADTSDLPGAVPAAGVFVEAKGAISGGVMSATKVEPDSPDVSADDRLDIDESDEVEIEIEGFITRFGSDTDFDVAGFPVVTTASTTFEGGDASDLAEDVKVEVEGDSLNAAGALVADKIDIRRSNDVRITALVDSVDVAAKTLVALGITARVDELTRFEDQSDAELEPFMLGDVVAGNYVEIRGGTDADGGADLVASLLERDDVPGDLNGETELRGFVESITDPSFTILGVTIQTNAGTTFRDANELQITSTAFFNALSVGTQVDVNGTENLALPDNPTIVADEVELED